MIQEIQKLVSKHLAWLRDRVSLREIDEQLVEITTPYLDCHNDHIQLYVKKEDDDRFLLTDCEYTINDLAQSGCNIRSPESLDLLEMILRGFGVRLHGDSLETHTTSKDFAVRLHSLAQAILVTSHTFYLVDVMGRKDSVA